MPDGVNAKVMWSCLTMQYTVMETDNLTSKKVAPFGRGPRFCPGADLAKVETTSRELGQEYTNGGRRDQGEGYMRHYRCFCNLFSPRGKEPQRSLDCVLASHVMQIMLETQPLISFPGCPTCVSMIYYMIYSCYEKDRFR
ncbi:hypothetical protein JHK82_031773 [Glycine max]|nr:hypothetical protein JHK85_032430 [Glycine max]KAG4995036.1 hypothetical protein JHK86_031863 [Glycine max]KAG5125036.1 hypothetical protein JHK82_031773 [Glycine max]KAG5146461.1 hypothetical protein JHK84_032004 [Glycine max]